MAAAGSVAITKQDHRPIKKYSFAWTSDGAGDVSGGAGLTSFVVSGEILRITTDPGTPAPTANYDVVLNDEEGVDVAMGFLANRHTTSTESVVPRAQGTLPNGTTQYAAPVFVDGPLELVVSNAGASKQGAVHVFVR